MTTYLITGVNRGIGAELAKQVVAAGHEIIGTSRIVADACKSLPEIFVVAPIGFRPSIIDNCDLLRLGKKQL